MKEKYLFFTLSFLAGYTYSQTKIDDERFEGISNSTTIKHSPTKKERTLFDQNQRGTSASPGLSQAERLSEGNGMSFTPNKGQICDTDGKFCPNVLYKGDGGVADIYLRKNGISYVFTNMGEVTHEADEKIEELIKTGKSTATDGWGQKQDFLQTQKIKVHRVDMDFANCNKNAITINEGEAEGYHNYYYAHCPNGVINVKQYNKVTCKNIYANIDVSYYGNANGGLKYDIIVKPFADPNQIKLHWTGAEELTIKNGKIKIKTSVNEFYESIPKVYQNINGKIIDIKTKYKLTSIYSEKSDASNYIVTLQLSTYNHSHPLIIDPFIWATYYGGSSDDYSTDIATDKTNGNVVVTGTTRSVNFPVSVGAFQTILNSGDAFVVKFDPNGIRLWATYCGGSSNDIAHGIATDALGNTVVTGQTSSTDFPVSAGAFQPTLYSGDAFVAKFNPAGALTWATYCGGTYNDAGYAITTDLAGNIVITGTAWSTDFPVTLGAFQGIYGGNYDAFVVKFNPTGGRLWATYYGGSGWDEGYGIATDALGNIVFTGQVRSTDFPVTAGAFQLGFNGVRDAYIVKLDPNGTRLWATYYGGSSGDYGHRIATDAGRNIIVTGETNSGNFPTSAGSFQPTYGGGGAWGDGFLIKFNPNGGRLWATYHGGNTDDLAKACAIDAYDNIYIWGEWEDVNNGNFPMNTCALQKTFGGTEDFFVTKFNPNGKRLCSTFIGGTGEEELDLYFGGIAVYGNYVYITGSNQGGGFPVTAGAFQTAFVGGYYDVIVAKFCGNSCGENNPVSIAAVSNTGTCANQLVQFNSSITSTITCDTANFTYNWTFSGGTPSSSIQRNPSGILFTSPGSHNVKLVLNGACGKDSITQTITINNCGCVMSAAAAITLNTSCSGANDGAVKATISNGSGGPYTYSWSNGLNGTTTSSTIPVTGLTSNTYTVTISEGLCVSVSTVTLLPQNTLTINSITATNASCYGKNNGSATVAISSSSGGSYSYSWSNGANLSTNSLNNSITGLTAGTYTVTITQGSCMATSTVTITQPYPLSVNASSTWSCFTNSGTATATAPNTSSSYSYLWNNGQNNAIATGLSLNTTYTVTLTDANGCTAKNTTTPTTIPMTTTTTSTNIGCNSSSGNASIAVNSGAGPISYVWSTGSIGTIGANGISTSITGLSVGTYSVTLTDFYGCTQIKTYTISGVNPVSATFTTSATCIGTAVNFTNTGSMGTYNWLITPTNVSGTTTNFSYTFLTGGSYSISHTVTNAGCSTTVTQNITVINCSGPSVTATGNSVCPGSCASVTSNSSGGVSPYTYSWSNGGTTQNIGPCPSFTTTYTVTIRDNGGNTSTSTAVVTVHPAVTVLVTPTNINCSGGSTGSAAAAGSNGSAPYTYNWSNGVSGSAASGLTVGAYTVTVTDNKGCTVNSTATITSPPPLAGQFTKGTSNCIGCGCKEWLMVNATGGTSPYSYSWPDGYVNRYKSQLCPGAYNINIVDKNGCSVNINLIAP